jgi:uncharacterized membrane protein YkoI
MNTLKIVTLGTATALALSFAGIARADSEMSSAAELQLFQAHPQTLSQAVAAAEQATGGKAIQADWEALDATTGVFEVEIVKPDGSMVRAKVAADGTVETIAMSADTDNDNDNESEGQN